MSNDSDTTLGSDPDWLSARVDGRDPAFFDGHSSHPIDFLSEFLFLWRFSYRSVPRYYWGLSLRSGKPEVKSWAVANIVN